MPEPLCYSFHAMKRCVERGISAKNVMDTITRGTRIANSGEKVVFARGRMRVVVTHEAMVVTAYRERRNNQKRNIRKAKKARRKLVMGWKS